MAGFRGVSEIVDAELSGRFLYRTFRKQPTQATSSGYWFDLSMSPGNPVPNYYIGQAGVFTPLAQSTDGGLPHPLAVQYKRQFLRKIMVMTPASGAVPLPMVLMDYLGFYSFIDESVIDEQALDNTLSITRHVGGLGVMMMPVVVAGQTGGQTFYVTYTNQDGVPGRTSRTVTMCTQGVNGTILCSAPAISGCNGPFIPFQDGDTGARSIEAVKINGTGDVGLFAIALVKPIASIALRGVDAPTEVDYLVDFSAVPAIEDDAYLNFICHPAGNLSGAAIHGEIHTVWG